MRRNILLLAIILLSGLQAYAQKNNLVVFSESGERFVLVLNGLRQNTEPATNVKVVDLNQPGYVLKIIYEDKKIPDLDKKFSFLNPGTEVVLAVKMKKGVRKLTYISEAPIKDNQSEANQKLIVYNAAPADTVITTTTTTTTTQSTPAEVNANKNTETSNNNTTTTSATNSTTGISINVNENGVSMKGTGMDVNVSTTGMNTDLKETPESTSNSVNENTTKAVSSDNSARYISNGTMCASPSMSQEQLVKLKYEIDQRSLVTKMKVAQEAIQKNCMQSNQVADLVKLFEYSSDQLELAKFAYKHTYDTKNYDVVVKALSHDYNKPTLVDFVGTSNGSVSPVNSSSSTNAASSASTTTTTTVTEKKVVSAPASTATASTGCYSAMPDSDFKTAKASIGAKSFEDSKLTMAKQVMKNKCLKTSQVKEIMDLFSFEETKLSFAKDAYSYTMDKDNYYLLNDAFSFETSIEDLNNYIESKK